MPFLGTAILVLLAAAAAAAPVGTNPVASAGDTCPQATGHRALDPGEPLKPRKLTELPPGKMYVAVYRRDSKGCEAPIVVKYDVGRR